MCFSKIYATKRFRGKHSKSKHGTMIGYKVFNGSIYPNRVRSQYMDGDFRLNKWYTASGDLVEDDNGLFYTSGYHIHLNQGDAINRAASSYKVYKVEFTDVVAIGEDKGLCVTAKRMRVLEQVK